MSTPSEQKAKETVKISCAVCGEVTTVGRYEDGRCRNCGQKYEYVGDGHGITLRPDQVHLLHNHWKNGP
jgi:hypothetical protein